VGNWLWFGGVVLGIVVLFGFLLWHGGGEPLAREDTGGGPDEHHDFGHDQGNGDGHA
jgi:hypothetical protein